MSTQTRSVTIETQPDRVWAVIADFGNVVNWAPRVLRSQSMTEPSRGTGARRVLHHRSGKPVEEVILDWSELRRSFTFEVVGPLGPFKTVREAWSVGPSHDAHGSVVSVTMSLSMRYGPLAPLLDALVGRRLMGRELALSLAGLKRYVEAAGRAPREPGNLSTSDAK